MVEEFSVLGCAALSALVGVRLGNVMGIGVLGGLIPVVVAAFGVGRMSVPLMREAAGLRSAGTVGPMAAFGTLVAVGLLVGGGSQQRWPLISASAAGPQLANGRVISWVSLILAVAALAVMGVCTVGWARLPIVGSRLVLLKKDPDGLALSGIEPSRLAGRVLGVVCVGAALCGVCFASVSSAASNGPWVVLAGIAAVMVLSGATNAQPGEAVDSGLLLVGGLAVGMVVALADHSLAGSGWPVAAVAVVALAWLRPPNRRPQQGGDQFRVSS